MTIAICRCPALLPQRYPLAKWNTPLCRNNFLPTLSNRQSCTAVRMENVPHSFHRQLRRWIRLCTPLPSASSQHQLEKCSDVSLPPLANGNSSLLRLPDLFASVPVHLLTYLLHPGTQIDDQRGFYHSQNQIRNELVPAAKVRDNVAVIWRLNNQSNHIVSLGDSS